MTFNIAGIAISQNYEDNIQELGELIDLELAEEGEITFGMAVADWKKDGICDVYFTENGTLVFLPIKHCMEPNPIADARVLTFIISEKSQAFSLFYSVGLFEERSIVEVNHERLTEEGNRLRAEDKFSKISEMILAQASSVIGKNFWKIGAEEKALRCSF